MDKIIGIDLGGTNARAAVVHGGKPVVVSTVSRRPHLDGRAPARLVQRLLGRRFDSDAVQRLAGRHPGTNGAVPYEIVQAPHGEAAIRIDGVVHSPRESSAIMLCKLRDDAQEFLGEPVYQAVVAVPAYFTRGQREATRAACRIAGIEVRRLVSEPIAAALAHRLADEERLTVAVYDLGGSTFSVSIVQLRDGLFEIKAIDGDATLGGEDLDDRIAALLRERLARTHRGLDLPRAAAERLWTAAEQAKVELSTSDEVSVSLPFIGTDDSGPKHLETILSRAEVEARVQDLIAPTLEACQRAVRVAGLRPADVDEVLLIGGQGRMPLVQQAVQGFFGRRPRAALPSETVVSVGAAIMGEAIDNHHLDGEQAEPYDRGDHRAELEMSRCLVVRACHLLVTAGSIGSDWVSGGVSETLRSDLLLHVDRLLQGNGFAHSLVRPAEREVLDTLRAHLDGWHPPRIPATLRHAAAQTCRSLEA